MKTFLEILQEALGASLNEIIFIEKKDKNFKRSINLKDFLLIAKFFYEKDKYNKENEKNEPNYSKFIKSLEYSNEGGHKRTCDDLIDKAKTKYGIPTTKSVLEEINTLNKFPQSPIFEVIEFIKKAA
jgi:hypothetical protein